MFIEKIGDIALKNKVTFRQSNEIDTVMGESGVMADGSIVTFEMKRESQPVSIYTVSENWIDLEEKSKLIQLYARLDNSFPITFDNGTILYARFLREAPLVFVPKWDYSHFFGLEMEVILTNQIPLPPVGQFPSFIEEFWGGYDGTWGSEENGIGETPTTEDGYLLIPQQDVEESGDTEHTSTNGIEKAFAFGEDFANQSVAILVKVKFGDGLEGDEYLKVMLDGAVQTNIEYSSSELCHKIITNLDAEGKIMVRFENKGNSGSNTERIYITDFTIIKRSLSS